MLCFTVLYEKLSASSNASWHVLRLIQPACCSFAMLSTSFCAAVMSAFLRNAMQRTCILLIEDAVSINACCTHIIGEAVSSYKSNAYHKPAKIHRTKAEQDRRQSWLELTLANVMPHCHCKRSYSTSWYLDRLWNCTIVVCCWKTVSELECQEW